MHLGDKKVSLGGWASIHSWPVGRRPFLGLEGWVLLPIGWRLGIGKQHSFPKTRGFIIMNLFPLRVFFKGEFPEKLFPLGGWIVGPRHWWTFPVPFFHFKISYQLVGLSQKGVHGGGQGTGLGTKTKLSPFSPGPGPSNTDLIHLHVPKTRPGSFGLGRMLGSRCTKWGLGHILGSLFHLGRLPLLFPQVWY